MIDRVADHEHPHWLNQRLAGADGNGVRVAVIDSGFRAGSAFPGWIQPGRSWVDPGDPFATLEGDDLTDRIGHGTAAGEIVHRLAPKATVVVHRVFGDQLETSPGTIIAAIDRAIEHRIEVINLSLGSPTEAAKAPFYAVCERARLAGSIVISAQPIGAETVYPACFDNVISVTAARFGNAYDLDHHPQASADYVAHGEISTEWQGESRTLYGSSFAAPHLSAMVALLRQRFPKADLDGIRSLLTELAEASREARRVHAAEPGGNTT